MTSSKTSKSSLKFTHHRQRLRSMGVYRPISYRFGGKTSLQSVHFNSSEIKCHMWKHFVDTSVTNHHHHHHHSKLDKAPLTGA